MNYKDFILKLRNIQYGQSIYEEINKSYVYNQIYRPFSEICYDIHQQAVSYKYEDSEINKLMSKLAPACRFIRGIDMNGKYYKFNSSIIYGLDYSAVKIENCSDKQKKTFVFKDSKISCFCNTKRFINGIGILIYVKYFTLSNDAHWDVYLSPIDFIELPGLQDDIFNLLQDNLNLTSLNFARKTNKTIGPSDTRNTKEYYVGVTFKDDLLIKLNKCVKKREWDVLRKVYLNEKSEVKL